MATSSTNEYLKLREEKIARNRSKLERLGLAGPYAVSSSKQNTHVPYLRPQKKRDKIHHDHQYNTNESTPIHLRRSSRVKNIVSYEEGHVVEHSVRKQGSRSDDHNGNQKQEEDKDSIPLSMSSIALKSSQEKSVIKERSIIKPGTTRSTSISIISTLFGNSNNDLKTHDPKDSHFTSFIGKYLSSPNKSSVIEHANYHSGNPSGISFNKYSGVCEFANAIFLWVNIGVQDGDVVNEFLNGGRQMTWYGGSRMTNDSPVIQRLIQLGKDSKAIYEKDKLHWNSPEYNQGIVLWCRIYDVSMKGRYTPYICMGRLGYQSHDEQSYPVKFVWDLLDYNILIKNNASALERLILTK